MHPCTLCSQRFDGCPDVCAKYQTAAPEWMRENMPDTYRVRQMVEGKIPWNSEPNEHSVTGV